MTQKQVFIDGIGEVTLARRRGTRNLRLSINAHGRVRVGLPHWVPFKAAIKFAEQRKDWIAKHQILNQQALLANGLKVGKAHRLYFYQDSKRKTVRTSVDSIGVHIYGPYGEQDDRTQLKARAACERALSQEATILLPQRLKSLSKLHGYRCRGLRIKKLTSRWGSCSSGGVITLSYYLMQLPWALIDYVIMHELTHTKYLDHGSQFWRAMEEAVPGAKKMQKQIRTHKPRIEPWNDLLSTPPSVSIDSDDLLLE